MPSADPQGTELYWDSGWTFMGVRNGGNNTGSELFWDEGYSVEQLYPLKFKTAFLMIFE
jgi:hypothetical protein